MGESDHPSPPAVGVWVHPSQAGTALLLELLAGLEEEGVPSRVATVAEETPVAGQPMAVALAHGAARASALEVGLGMDATGALALHHRRAQPDKPVFVAPGNAVDGLMARAFGVNAARLVKVQPLILQGQHPGRDGKWKGERWD